MFAYEIYQERRNEFEHRADQWRLARDARAARAAERRERRTGTGRAVRTDTRTDTEGASSPRRSPGRVHRVLHPRSAS
ncbi:hypothetical protein [Actinacidiphila acididurans]|uniref:Uncharacterized protein n=1 Tax=Actinacidiphila acididurans TaxID=2784346 RepID=A0ABS2TKI1_9ACTN|nr:hypothetical protein [Actinacidiphila acididurans]MBM9503844.1 hypothetical protein [Actinacidiphila acididurans]